MATTRKEVYIPLDPQKQEIRLLHLSPGSFSSALRGTLGTTTLTQPLAYEALSYAWGTEVSSNRLVLDGYELEITKNLEIALRYVSYSITLNPLKVNFCVEGPTNRPFSCELSEIMCWKEMPEIFCTSLHSQLHETLLTVPPTLVAL